MAGLIDKKKRQGCYITDSEELCQQMAKIVGKRGVDVICGVSYEEVKISGRNAVGIINTDVASGAGKHWVSFAHLGKLVIYYDSLGEPPTPEIAAKIAPRGEELIYWDGQQQPDSSDKCGFYALNFIRNLMDHWDDSNNLFDYYFMDMNPMGTAGNDAKVLKQLQGKKRR